MGEKVHNTAVNISTIYSLIHEFDSNLKKKFLHSKFLTYAVIYFIYELRVRSGRISLVFKCEIPKFLFMFRCPQKYLIQV